MLITFLIKHRAVSYANALKKGQNQYTLPWNRLKTKLVNIIRNANYFPN